MNLKDRIRSVVGERGVATYRQFRRRLRHAGLRRYCPVCRSPVRGFEPCGRRQRPDCLCPVCRSRERHRLTWLFFTKQTDLFDGRPKLLLHVAPEDSLRWRLHRAEEIRYVSADLRADDVRVAMDITDIGFGSDCFDVIYCSHVLEHVPDDRRAMRELHRVLAPDGWAVLLVPITAEQTFEDPSIADPRERERLFGQHDHVRRYGPDYQDRLEEAGFTVRRVTPEDLASEARREWYGMANESAAGDIYCCTKP